jgi:Tol biopolymer transport system component
MEIRRWSQVITVLSVSLLLTVTNTTPASGGDNPYNISVFKSVGDWSTAGYKPDLLADEIIFHQDSSIWIMNTSSSIKKQLIYSNESIDYTFTGPKFSPDGEKIVFIQRGKPTGFFLNVLEKNGTKWDESATLVTIYTTEKLGLRQPSFSSNGNTVIYYSLEGGGKGDIWSICTDSTNRTQLTFDGEGGYYPSYSADGDKIIYGRSNSRGYHEIWIMNSDGSSQKRILDDTWYPERPVFMPNGQIMFESARVSPNSDNVGAPSIWMMEQDGSNRTLLVPSVISSVGSTDPTINRNGTRIAFEHGIGESFRLYIVDDPDGDGEWEDSDGDHVADICDGYPFDPERGYIKDDDDLIPGFGSGSCMISVILAVPVVLRRKRAPQM